LEKFLTKEALKLSKNKSDHTTVVVVDVWNHTDFMCKNYILNELDNTFYDVYCQIKSEKALWEALDKNYKAEDAGVKKFIVTKFIDLKWLIQGL
jgi:translation elongation factor EF-Ts